MEFLFQMFQLNDLKQETFDFFRKRAFRSQRIDEESLADSNEHLIENLQLKEGKFLKRASICFFTQILKNI
jgi:ATP-dependent DNA helicase RecG